MIMDKALVSSMDYARGRVCAALTCAMCKATKRNVCIFYVSIFFPRMHCTQFAGADRINLQMDTSSLYAIVGPVGASKTTLLQTILGELDLDDGTLTVNGTVCYASQEPWIFEGTIKQNILFTEAFDEKR